MCCSKKALAYALAVLASITTAASAERFDQIVGAETPGGDAVLVKHFRVRAGSVISGVQFFSNDLRTTFPRVTILLGSPEGPLSEATQLAAVDAVRAVGAHRAVVACTPIEIGRDQDVLVAIRMPPSAGVRGLGDGAGVAARALTGPATSYFASEPTGHLGAMDVDYGIELVYQTMGKSEVGPDAGAPRPEEFIHTTFLQVGNSVSADAARIEFGLEHPGVASLVIYDIAGRRVRKLANERLDAGSHVLEWDWRDDAGAAVAAGVYVLRFAAPEKVVTKKLVRAK